MPYTYKPCEASVEPMLYLETCSGRRRGRSDVSSFHAVSSNPPLSHFHLLAAVPSHVACLLTVIASLRYSSVSRQARSALAPVASSLHTSTRIRQMSAATSFYSLKAEKPKGEIDFKELEGKVVLVSEVV